MTWGVWCCGVSPERVLCVEPESGGAEGSALSLWQLPDSPDRRAPALLSRSTQPSVRSLSWHPSNEACLALGHASGRVQLLSPLPVPLPATTPLELPPPKHPRPALALAFSPSHPHWLAGGYDRHRTEKGLVVWDLADSLAFAADASGQPGLRAPASLSPRPRPDASTGSLRRRKGGTELPVASIVGRSVFELAHGEAVQSLLWLRQGSRSLALGLSGRYIRVVDLRADPNKHQLSLTTKAVLGLDQCPWSEQQVLSYSEGQLAVWDLRVGKAEKPLFSITESRPILHAAWDPLRKDALSVLCRGASSVRTYRLQRGGTDDADVAFTDRHFIPLFPKSSSEEGAPERWDSELLTGFAWHSTRPSTLIALAAGGSLVCQEVHERLCVDWAPSNGLAASFGPHLFAADEFRFRIL